MEPVPGHSVIRQFEYTIADHFGVQRCLSVCNATMGITGVFQALGLAGTEIILSPLTWPGAIAGLLMLNCKLKFCDVEPVNLTIDPELISAFVSKHTKAVFSADFLGYPAQLDKIKQVCAEHNLLLIHDAATSFGTLYKDRYSGSFADITIFSFGAGKVFTMGEGGCIVTGRDDLFSQLVKFLKHPKRQSTEDASPYPFALNLNINPLAARYAIDSFGTQLENINARKEKAMFWTRQHGIAITPGQQPNFHKLILNPSFLARHKGQLDLLPLPYPALIYNEPGFPGSRTMTRCTCAEKAIDSYKTVSIT